VALQDAAAYLSSSLSNCRTLHDVVTEIEPRLRRLGLDRCFLAVGSPEPGEGDDGAVPGEDVRCRLALSYRQGSLEAPTGEVFPRHELLPASLRHELSRGVLLLQPLSIGGRERGHLLFEPVEHSYLLTEALRVELPRTVDFVLSWQEMRDHSAMLERLVAQRTHELERANAELNRAVLRDGLTGAANRLAFQQHLEACGERAGDPARRMGVLMIDVDYFKAFNDHYGHLVGDDALRVVAACLLKAAREPEDLVCRYGGEEFAVLLTDSSAGAALAVARRFHVLLEQAAIPHQGSPVAPVVTASVGVASTAIGSGADVSRAVAAADRALYQAKTQGRNTTVLADPGRPGGSEGPAASQGPGRRGPPSPRRAVARPGSDAVPGERSG
jgi:diguanylate cyclase (GGDEF)-like protein